MSNHLDRAREGGATPIGTAMSGMLLFLFALALRLYLLYDLHESPSFEFPLVDAAAHHRLALGFQASDSVPTTLFWRSVFYPLYLGATYFATGSSILAAKLLQAFLGAATCWLTYRVARREFGHACGVTAGCVTALYGPLIFWELELVAVGWAAFWSVALLWLAGRARETGAAPIHFLFGLVCGLAVLTRPSFLLFSVLTIAWLGFAARASGGRVALARVSIAAAGFLSLTIPTAIVSNSVAQHASFLPRSGSLNLYIGNHPDRCDALQTRPGTPWRELAAGVAREATADDDGVRIFRKRVIEQATADPMAFATGIAHKLGQLANSREIPRNVDIYLFREWSPLLGALVWKVKGFGFPFGVLLPLAILGIWLRRRDVPAPLLILLFSYPLVIAATFVAGRYRAPLVPALAILAAAGVLEIFARLRRGEWRTGLLPLAIAVALMLLLHHPDPYCEEEIDFHSEMYTFIAMDVAMTDDAERANALFETALEINPDSARVHQEFADFLTAQKQMELALLHYDEAIALSPDYWTIAKRGAAYFELGELARAREDFQRSIELDPDYSPAYLGRAAVSLRRGRREAALADTKRALETASSQQEAATARNALRTLRRNAGR